MTLEQVKGRVDKQASRSERGARSGVGSGEECGEEMGLRMDGRKRGDSLHVVPEKNKLSAHVQKEQYGSHELCSLASLANCQAARWLHQEKCGEDKDA